MEKELRELRKCRSNAILFLDVSQEEIFSRKAGDLTRSRKSFGGYITGLNPFERQWFERYEYTTFLNTDKMTILDIENWASEWVQDKWKV